MGDWSTNGIKNAVQRQLDGMRLESEWLSGDGFRKAWANRKKIVACYTFSVRIARAD